jgi:hypothetical protein
VDEINRYRPGKIVILDPQLGGCMITGTFHLDSLDDFRRHGPIFARWGLSSRPDTIHRSVSAICKSGNARGLDPGMETGLPSRHQRNALAREEHVQTERCVPPI